LIDEEPGAVVQRRTATVDDQSPELDHALAVLLHDAPAAVCERDAVVGGRGLERQEADTESRLTDESHGANAGGDA
jgi:hypothetical protein